MVVPLADANNLACHLKGVRVFGVKTCDEGISFACFHHHHAKVVALIHLVLSFLRSVALTFHLLGKELCIAVATFVLRVVAQVQDFDAIKVQLQFLSCLTNLYVIAQQDGEANALFLSAYSSLEHVGVCAFSIYHTFGVRASSIVEVLRELTFLTHQLTQVLAISLPVLNRCASYTAIHRSFGNSHWNLGDKTGVNRFGNEVIRTKGEVAYVVSTVYDIGYRATCQVRNSASSCHLHFLVDGRSSCVECTAEDIGETNNVVDLVRIVCATCTHQNIGASSCSILVWNFGYGVGQCKDDGVVSHGAYHVLCEHIAFWKTYKDIGTIYSLCQSVDISACGSKFTLLCIQVFAVGSDNALRVEHHYILLLSTKGTIEACAWDGCCTGTIHYNLNIFDILASHHECID